MQLDARHPGQADVEHEAASARRSAALEERFGRAEHLCRKSLRLQNAAHGLAHSFVVVDDCH
jgi:hypothetical protein